jgi:PAS domain S-box-containing protein
MEPKRLTILVVDDNPDNIRVLEALLADTFSEAAVVTALDGASAIEQATAADPDVILLDIVMPGMDGFEVCRRLKDDERSRHIPVVFLTALRTDRENHIQALEAGGEAFLSKPIDELELTAQIRAMAKIKAANKTERREKARLAVLVAERTRELEQELAERRQAEERLRLANQELERSQASALNLLEDLRAENAVRKRIEESLRESDARYSVLFDSIADSVAVAGITNDGLPGRFLAVNEAALLRLGYTREEFLRLTPRDLDAPESGVDTEAVMARLKRGEKVLFEHTQVAKDGRRIPVEVNSQVFQMQGRPLVLSVARDVTERRQAEARRERLENTQAFLAQHRGLGGDGDFFHALVRYLCESLGADFVCIDRLHQENLQAQTVAVYCDGTFQDNVAYTLKDTPCGEVVGKVICCFTSGVSALFPKDQVLREMKAEGYVGATLWSSQGQPIGLIALIWRQPLANPELAKSVLGLVTGRAAGELERIEVENALRRSLDEKESLLKEVHHRVKNNLQVVASLMNLQSNRVHNPEVAEILRETQSRVRAMALLHETLYRSSDLAHINFQTYLGNLCKYLFRSNGPEAGGLQFQLQAVGVELGLDQAVPCGLIVSELVTNALKHGFPGGRTGTIVVELRAEARDLLRLIVADNGVGLPASFDARRTQSLGLQLVFNLASQLRGTVGVESAGGTLVTVTFPRSQTPSGS